MATVEDACANVQRYIAQLAGIRSAPEKPPDSINIFPTSVCHPSKGLFKHKPQGVVTGLHSITITIYLENKNNRLDWAQIYRFVHEVPNRLFTQFTSDHWGSSVAELGEIDLDYVTQNYGGVDLRALQFVVRDVKIQTVIS